MRAGGVDEFAVHAHDPLAGLEAGQVGDAALVHRADEVALVALGVQVEAELVRGPMFALEKSGAAD